MDEKTIGEIIKTMQDTIRAEVGSLFEKQVTSACEEAWEDGATVGFRAGRGGKMEITDLILSNPYSDSRDDEYSGEDTEVVYDSDEGLPNGEVV